MRSPKRIRKVLLWGLAALLGLALLPAQVATVWPSDWLTAWPTGFWVQPAIAQTNAPVEQLQQQQQDIETQRSNLNQERDRLQNLEQAAQQNLEGLQQTIQATTAQIQEAERRFVAAQQQLQQLQQDLLVAEKAYEVVQQAAVARLQFLQRQQHSRGWAVLLQSQDLNQFIDRRRQLRLVYAADRSTLVDLKGKADELQQQRAEVENQKNQVALAQQELLAQKQQYEAQAQQQTQMIDRLRQDRSALEAAEAQLARDSAKLAELIRQRIAAQSSTVPGTGQMIYPAAGSITSGFGTRIHPILGYRRFHSGVDFGASYGSTIRAADSGRVIFSGWYGGYGQAVIIDHGSGITSLYGHASELYVSEGQAVQQGQAIAAIGSTGLSTGPHLHFEVRRDGEPVNPMNFL
ncbi:MAG: peptidoglycan DD-metalloendopeptidase family protein [Leptolyngbyaceae cyanobacterium SM1_1_3]|nr:peptidoglycan DD-metalloendopeptidase family protein [Leptolyngbyaceae cyanobacterium SM1_1_3]NJN05055.1 peptidoglycan DD-metalloendopeptidase family protein [Leptolyngbyaceae cyanobacterium RM1_1_2]NJO10276.1 peptidoglycan DD-metalloendopeptidase family protein [Leptolyngbyaceae cyanobacterium SL_1_1]